MLNGTDVVIILDQIFRSGSHLSDAFPVQIDLKQGDTSSPLLFCIAFDTSVGSVKKL